MNVLGCRHDGLIERWLMVRKRAGVYFKMGGPGGSTSYDFDCDQKSISSSESVQQFLKPGLFRVARHTYTHSPPVSEAALTVPSAFIASAAG